MAKKMNALSCGAQCSRITLITLNVIFLICGIALLVLGCVFRFGSDQIKEDIKPTFEAIEFQGLDLYNLVNNLGIIFIVIGAIVILFSVFGFIGAACFVSWCLVLYSILIGICLIIELAGVVLFFIMESELKDAAVLGMQKSIKESNKGNEDYKKATVYMMETMECCHVGNERLNATIQPDMCTLASDANSKDCYEAFKDWVKEYQYAFIGIGICIMVVEVFLIVFACCVCRASRKEELV